MWGRADGWCEGERVTDSGFDVVLIADGPRRDEGGEAIGLVGGRVIATLGWGETAELARQSPGRPVLVLEAEGVAETLLLDALPHVREIAETFDLPVVARHSRAQIDVVAGALIGLRAQLLCEVEFGRWVGEMAIAGQSAEAPGLADRWREGEAERLKSLNEDVARIAELLARLASRARGGGGTDDGSVGDRNIAFGFEPPAAAVDPQLIRQAIRGRRLRDAFFGEGLFEDPAWDMLLDLYAAQLEGQRVSVSSLCIAAAVAPTTALRWIGKLTEAGMFERHPDPADRRRAFMALSPRVVKGMEAYIAAMRRAGSPIA